MKVFCGNAKKICEHESLIERTNVFNFNKLLKKDAHIKFHKMSEQKFLRNQ